MPQTLFISDLHLDWERPQIIDLFSQFLQQQARQAEALYILGDLFEYWIGDDAPARGLESTISGLRTLTEQGTSVYLMHGNRDFLIGKRFSQRTGCHLLPEMQVIDLYSVSTLIMHGDTLCTDDKAYQAFRAKIRNKLVQRILLSLSRTMRQRIATHLRNQSRRETNNKPAEIMDANPQAVEQVMIEYNVTRLIHGHTHRPAIHRFQLNGKQASRYVLGDWYEQGSVLRCTLEMCDLNIVT
jgi:UDP-2,3-diacylglucosamine hydrolase